MLKSIYCTNENIANPNPHGCALNFLWIWIWLHKADPDQRHLKISAEDEHCARSCELGLHCCPNECIFRVGKLRGVGILEWGVYEPGEGNGRVSLRATWEQGGRILSQQGGFQVSKKGQMGQKKNRGKQEARGDNTACDPKHGPSLKICHHLSVWAVDL